MTLDKTISQLYISIMINNNSIYICFNILFVFIHFISLPLNFKMATFLSAYLVERYKAFKAT